MTATPSTLPRVVGLRGAVMMGLGSILGTGVFVSIAFAAEVAGPAVVFAIALAGCLAAANGLSSAQLAAAHPVSGGTYEYGYLRLTPALGFTAGWMFLCAKSASAATAALGFAGYVLAAAQVDMTASPWMVRVPLALAALIVLTFIVLAGAKRSSAVNIMIVTVTLVALLFFIAVCLPRALREGGEHLWPVTGTLASGGHPALGVLQASALMFVAFTGYGRIATLGEEIHDPARNIPRAIILTLILAAMLYLGVALAGIGAVGVDVFGGIGAWRGAPLQETAHRVAGNWAGIIITVGAITAMLGVLLNLILGLSRVALAMGRRGDLPRGLAQLDEFGRTPARAVIFIAFVIGGLVMVGDVKTTWSFSAFTVLVYYAITNLAALRLPREARRYPRWIAVLGLIGCAFLAFWVEMRVWSIGLAIMLVGLAWHLLQRRRLAKGGMR